MVLNQQPPNPRPRRLGPCHRHPGIPVTTGLCASCLRERLSLLNPSSSDEPSTSASAADGGGPLPELRRCKTFSANNCHIALGLEPRRRSCDVRARVSDGSSEKLQVESENVRFLRKGTCPGPEEEEDESNNRDFEVAKVSDLPILDENEDSKTMKEFIDLEFQANPKASNRRDFREIAGNFWVAASVFSKKLKKWRKKQGTKEHFECNPTIGHDVGLGEMQLERLRGRRLRLRDTQSEVGEYGFGRRSCDTDPRGSMDFGCAFGRMSCDTEPRFSIDLGRASIDCGRISVEDARNSVDPPRASWDGYLIGRRSLPGGGSSAPVVSVIENAMATVYGFDHHRILAGGNKMKVGAVRSMSMKDRFLDADSLQMRRKGFDRSNSLKKDITVIADGEAKPLSNAAIGIFNGTKLLITEKELNEWRLNSLKNDIDSSESSETASKDLTSVSSSTIGKDFKKCRQWGKLWSTWGLLNRRKGDNNGSEEEKLERGNAKCSHANSVGGGSGPGTRKTESTLALVNDRYSPNRFDKGLLRLYLTPLGSRRRDKLAKGRLKKSNSLARSVLRL